MQKQVIEDDRQPVLSMIVKPRETFRYAIDAKAFSLSLYIGAVGGFSSAIMSYFQTKRSASVSLAQIVNSSLLSGVIGNLIMILVIGYLTKVVGEMFSARATFKEIFQAFCLATIPYIWLLPILLFWMQLSPDTYFRLDFSALVMQDVLVLAFGAIAIFVASLWTFVLTLVGLSEVMKVSKLRVFGVLLLVCIIIVIVAVVITTVVVTTL